MNENFLKYWMVTVQFEIENDKGKVRKIKEPYLIDAMSATEAEAKLHEYMKERGEHNFEVIRAVKSGIIEVIQPIRK